MAQDVDPDFRDISDTARWVAHYRAIESERRDALFRDPFARRLAGGRGLRLHDATLSFPRPGWAFVMRTLLFDAFIGPQLAAGVDMVVNLGAGLDARPYRMALPSTLRWIEVDLPGLIQEKTKILADEKPRCDLERIPLDLADVGARRSLLSRLGGEAKKALIVTEGLIIYLTRDQVSELARDLMAQASFSAWVTDLSSPGLVQMMPRRILRRLEAASTPLRFAPEEGPDFFQPFGWRVREVRSLFSEAVRHGRVPFWMKVLTLFREPTGRQGRRPWSGVCLLSKA